MWELELIVKKWKLAEKKHFQIELYVVFISTSWRTLRSMDVFLPCSVIIFCLLAFSAQASLFSYTDRVRQNTRMSGAQQRNKTWTQDQKQSMECSYHICFVVDGSEYINAQEYNVSKRFIQKVVSSVFQKKNITLSAVQIGLSIDTLSEPTKNIRVFNSSIRRAVQNNGTLAFVPAGLGYCIRKFQNDTFTGPKTIVYVGSGQSSVSNIFLLETVKEASPAKIFSVGLGRQIELGNLLLIASNVSSNVFVLNASLANGTLEQSARSLSIDLCPLLNMSTTV